MAIDGGPFLDYSKAEMPFSARSLGWWRGWLFVEASNVN
jgi:hypothetical protein